MATRQRTPPGTHRASAAADPSARHVANEDESGAPPSASAESPLRTVDDRRSTPGGWSRVRELINDYPVVVFFGVVGLVAAITVLSRD